MKALIRTPDIKHTNLKWSYLKGWPIHQITIGENKLAHRQCLNRGIDFTLLAVARRVNTHNVINVKGRGAGKIYLNAYHLEIR